MKLEELKKICSEATPAPWKYDVGNWAVEGPYPKRHQIASMTPDDREDNPVASLVDGLFIATSREIIPNFAALLSVCKDIIEHGYHRSKLIEAVKLVEGE